MFSYKKRIPSSLCLPRQLGNLAEGSWVARKEEEGNDEAVQVTTTLDTAKDLEKFYFTLNQAT